MLLVYVIKHFEFYRMIMIDGVLKNDVQTTLNYI